MNPPFHHVGPGQPTGPYLRLCSPTSAVSGHRKATPRVITHERLARPEGRVNPNPYSLA